MFRRQAQRKPSRLKRWAIKSAIFCAVLLAVCFPNPSATCRHLSHIRDPQAMIDPDAPGVIAISGEIESALRKTANDPSAADQAIANDPRLLESVEAVVYHRVKYAYDWDTWGNLDYLPTVSEVIELGREDCDGRAVLAASVLTRLGVGARLVGNTSHVWVWTPIGETMGPQGAKAVEVTPGGVQINWRGIVEIPRTLAFGVAMFPLIRELILTATIWLLILPRGVSPWRASIIGSLMFAALLALRWGGWPTRYGWLITGLVLLALAVMMAVKSPRRDTRESGKREEFTIDPREQADVAM